MNGGRRAAPAVVLSTNRYGLRRLSANRYPDQGEGVPKNFFLKAEEIVDLARGHGSCFATDMITVEGRKVGYMYREQPDNEIDSGWRFFSGSETQEYLDQAENSAIYDVNTIANYDLDIIPLLDAPAGSSLEREGGAGKFVPVDDPEDIDEAG